MDLSDIQCMSYAAGIESVQINNQLPALEHGPSCDETYRLLVEERHVMTDFMDDLNMLHIMQSFLSRYDVPARLETLET